MPVLSGSSCCWFQAEWIMVRSASKPNVKVAPAAALIIAWLQVRVLRAPPRSSAQMRFPAVSGKTPGFPRHSPGPGLHSRSPQAVMADRGGKNAARSLARANRFPADFIPTAGSRPAITVTPTDNETKCSGHSRRNKFHTPPLAAAASPSEVMRCPATETGSHVDRDRFAFVAVALLSAVRLGTRGR
jgi:hypothetical protein